MFKWLCVCLLLVGLRESDVAQCVEWMHSFAHVIERQNPVELKKFAQIPLENAHNIQTHTVSLELLVSVGRWVDQVLVWRATHYS